jgi:hypothetical protein
MAAIAHNPAFAKKSGVPVSVGKHFTAADKGKKFKEGGEMKPNELRGKAKETKAIAREEMKALKRGHAPKDVMEHERAEHKAMGYKHGGRIVKQAKAPKDEMKQVKYGMKETAGGRKTPHGKHDMEGDSKLKGFGMGQHSKPGRRVSRAHAPKDETPQKGFGMKRGGVAHMKKGGIRRPMPAMPGLPGQLAGALGAMGGPPMGATPPPTPPQPGMKKGGHVIHHHHHYAKGGKIKRMADGGLPVQGGPVLPPPAQGMGPGVAPPRSGGPMLQPGMGPGVALPRSGGPMLQPGMGPGGFPPRRGGPMLDPRIGGAMQRPLPAGSGLIGQGAAQGLGANYTGQRIVPTPMPMSMAYKKGGSIRREDGIASKGHTRGKIVKMASGGHVGSAAGRADGCASKGRTKCKIR